MLDEHSFRPCWKQQVDRHREASKASRQDTLNLSLQQAAWEWSGVC